MQVQQNIETLADDEHVLQMWTPLDINVTKQYQFVPQSILFQVVSNLFFDIVYGILFCFDKLM